jgi:hypothetical protein
MLYLAVGEEFICAELQTSGENCELDARQSTTISSDGQQNTYLGVCPCAAGLTCSNADSSEEGDVWPNVQILGVCKTAEPETDEEDPAD